MVLFTAIWIFEINQQVMIYCDLIVVNKFAWSQKPEARFPNIYGRPQSTSSSRLRSSDKPSPPPQAWGTVTVK